MELFKLIALSSLALSLSSCVPAILGTDASRPIPTSSGEFSIHNGETQFISVEYSASYLNFSRALVDSIAPVDFKNANALNQVRSIEGDVSWLRQKSANLPKDWDVQLVRSKIIRKTSRTEEDARYTTVYFNDYINLTFKITSPANEYPGIYRMSLDLVGNSGVSGTVDLVGKIAYAPNKA